EQAAGRERAQHRIHGAFLEQRLAFVGTLQALGDLVAVEVLAASIQYPQEHERHETRVEVLLELARLGIIHLLVLLSMQYWQSTSISNRKDQRSAPCGGLRRTGSRLRFPAGAAGVAARLRRFPARRLLDENFPARSHARDTGGALAPAGAGGEPLLQLAPPDARPLRGPRPGAVEADRRQPAAGAPLRGPGAAPAPRAPPRLPRPPPPQPPH